MVDGAAARECGLCGARSGDARAVADLGDAEAAAEHGYGGPVWPLVQELRSLSGLAVDGAEPGDVERRKLPRVELIPKSAGALRELENLANSLQLGGAALHSEWRLTVTSGRHLTFVLAPLSGSDARGAQLDLATLARQFARDRRLSWWHETPEG